MLIYSLLLIGAPCQITSGRAGLNYVMSMHSPGRVPKFPQIDSFTRRYYEKELGAGVGPSLSGTAQFGYTNPCRRFVQNEPFSPQANEIPNTAASWLPGDD